MAPMCVFFECHRSYRVVSRRLLCDRLAAVGNDIGGGGNDSLASNDGVALDILVRFTVVHRHRRRHVLLRRMRHSCVGNLRVQ